MMRKGMAAAALAFALALPAFACPQAAFADEPAEGDNAVNVTQLPDSSFIYDTSITDLITADTYYDKQTVQGHRRWWWRSHHRRDGRHCWLRWHALRFDLRCPFTLPTKLRRQGGH